MEPSYLFILGQTLCVAQSLAAAVHLQQHRFAVAVGAAVSAAGHGQVVHAAEAFEAGVAAQFMDRAVQDHLVFTLLGNTRRRTGSQRFVLCGVDLIFSKELVSFSTHLKHISFCFLRSEAASKRH